MSDQHSSRQLPNPLVTSVGQAAATLATALTEYLGRALEAAGHRAVDQAGRALDEPTRGDPAMLALQQTFTQYRAALGDLATILPQVIQRAGRQIQAEQGMKLLFQARHKNDASTPTEEQLRAVIEQLGSLPAGTRCVITRGTRDRIEAQDIRQQAADKTINEIFSDPRCRDLPGVLEALKQAVRDDRTAGLRAVHHALGWLKDGAAFDLLDKLESALGSDCLSEILHRFSSLRDFWSGISSPASPADENGDLFEHLQAAFSAIGKPLSGSVSILVSTPSASVLARPGSTRSEPTEIRSRAEYVVLDHEFDKIYRIRRGRDDGPGKIPRSRKEPDYRVEVYGLEDGNRYEFTDGCTDCKYSFHLPHRIHDARQGATVWAVDRRSVQEVLDAQYNAGTDVKLRAWDMGAGRTPLALFAVEYRDTDLGSYLEIGLGCFVAPRRDPLSVGMLVLEEMPVSTEMSETVGNTVWGFGKKVYSRDREKIAPWSFRVGARSATWTLDFDASKTRLLVEFPRGGERASARIPLLSYTRKFGQWHATVFTRSGSGEVLRVGGHGVRVALVGSKGDLEDKQTTGGLLGLLRWFDLVDLVEERGTDPFHRGRRPAYSLWTEKMSGELGPPALVPMQPRDEED